MREWTSSVCSEAEAFPSYHSFSFYPTYQTELCAATIPTLKPTYVGQLNNWRSKMFNTFQCTDWVAKHFGDRFAMAPGLVLQVQVMLHLLQILWNYCVPALSALGIPIWYSFLQMCYSFWQIYNRFQFPWILSVAHAFNTFRSFVKRLKVLDLELSITKQIILKTCVYLSRKSQVLIWQANFHLPAAVFLQIYSLSCSHEKLKIYLSQKIPAF